MGKGSRVNKNFSHPTNEKRGIAKKKRNKGKLAMGELGHSAWTQKFDPLYGVKGVERHIKKKSVSF